MKTKALISFENTAKLICVFVFAYVKRRSSHEAAHIILTKIWRTGPGLATSVDLAPQSLHSLQFSQHLLEAFLFFQGHFV